MTLKVLGAQAPTYSLLKPAVRTHYYTNLRDVALQGFAVMLHKMGVRRPRRKNAALGALARSTKANFPAGFPAHVLLLYYVSGTLTGRQVNTAEALAVLAAQTGRKGKLHLSGRTAQLKPP